MATLFSWSVLEFGQSMGLEHQHAKDAIKWGTDYLLKSTSIPGSVVGVVGNPVSYHICWERPEDMDTPRTSYIVINQRKARLWISLGRNCMQPPLQLLPWYLEVRTKDTRLCFSTEPSRFSCLQRSIGRGILQQRHTECGVPVLLRLQWLHNNMAGWVGLGSYCMVVEGNKEALLLELCQTQHT